VWLFGAGHVGRALAHALAPLPLTLTVIDSRDDFLAGSGPAGLPEGVTTIATDRPEGEVPHAPPDAVFLVLTHSHALDFELVRAILARGDFRFLGLIGSAAKRSSFRRRLAARGVAQADLDRITCPIGIAGIAGKEPAVIAASVAAQVIGLRRGAATRHRSDSNSTLQRSAR
jgi:xanthine dehydrogenase accessory factor